MEFLPCFNAHFCSHELYSANVRLFPGLSHMCMPYALLVFFVRMKSRPFCAWVSRAFDNTAMLAVSSGSCCCYCMDVFIQLLTVS